MRAVVASEAGGPEVLQIEDRPVPTPGPGTVLVRVSSVGVNFADIVMRRGEALTPLPIVPGVEGSGIIEALGSDVEGFVVGDRVAWTPTRLAAQVGSYAEHCLVGAGQIVPVPNDISLETASAVLLQGVTAHYLVHEIRPIESGTRVLVHAAAGGTGRTVVPWLRRLGAEVFATVGSEAKVAVAAEAGADHVIEYRDVDVVETVAQLTNGRGVDYVVDGVGGPEFRKNLQLLSDYGLVCLFGRAGGLPAQFSPLELVGKSLSVRGAMSNQFLRTRKELAHRAGEVFNGVREGWLKPLVHSVHSLEQAGEAHRVLEGRESVGKLLLRVEAS